ncbi:threonyl-tRNA synthetase [Butyrivibrio fibrisolvens DSM 3071]|jgi:threonyl-tRNA synthetase|uniref:Threonine--tRNA ligase n=1 Tax=Butyrivibrio fibrisolvens DSM 3071 TaxID=1121131 RepID=A0A1M6AUL9_BUTFI|nr:threonine--tRNA ligase [Butyrivibrio fibrisolvens]SHI40166.1 threonyl-tRNA synthetase [Butyrivibrio fibrisolvens DSM 3071]
MEKEEFLQVYRHSLAHILAKAVIEIYGKENVQYAIGPQIDDGAYYDFVIDKSISPDDFKTIEDKMREIIKRREDWTRKEVSKEEALEMFKDQKFKTELIQELPEDETITVYYTGEDYVDLCRGPHVANSQELMNCSYQVKSVSAAYWRGDEKRDHMQRVYIYAFPDKNQLKAHLAMIKEAMERDHKKIGKDLDLFMFNETAPGMAYWLPRGWRMYQELLKFSREIQDKHGYTEISAPLINNKKLWLISGHWAHYVNNMFMVPGITDGTKAEDTISSDETAARFSLEAEDTMAAKPMNCPNAMMAYKRTNHSYKELPIRYSEYDVLHRKEKSGQMNGLFRVQEFRQDDDHTFVTEEQIKSEINDVMNIADEIYGTFGITYRAEFSTRPDDFMGDIEVWNKAEAALKEILDDKYGEGGYEINEGDGAFYGPKIDLQIKDALGREWQCGTMQLDFQLPHNFELTYQDKDGQMKQPVVVHRAIYGSLERFIGIITEHFKGAYPFWLSPYQVGIVPIREEHNEYAEKIANELTANHVRVELDTSDSNMKEKIKKFKNYKDPYILVIGDKEAAEGTVSINVRGSNKQIQNVPFKKFVEMCNKMNLERSLELIQSLDEE